MIELAVIVEGHGDVEAVPILLRRMLAEIAPSQIVKIHRPIRVPRMRVVKPRELERAIELACALLRGEGAILVLLDADDDCPKQLAPHLLARAEEVAGPLPVSTVLATREFESWFLAAAASLAGCRGLPAPLVPPESPESIRGAKEWLRERMPSARGYSETLDQPALAATFDLEAARRGAPSFAKLHRDLLRLANISS